MVTYFHNNYDYVKESDYNTLVVRSWNELQGWAYKIPDPPKGVAAASAKRPFDIIAYDANGAWAIESKFNKGYSAFQYTKRLEPHQVYHLQQLTPFARTVVLLGVWKSRKFLHSFVFDFEDLWSFAETVPSLHKPVLQRLYEKQLYVDKYSNKLLKTNEFLNNIITKEVLEKVI